MVRPDILQLENHLQRISRKFISYDKDVNDAFRQHFYEVSSYVIECLVAKDAIFAKIFQVLQLAGSYADGIKVTAPNEFDVLVLLKFPRPVPAKTGSPGYVTINIKDGINTWLGWMTGNEEKYKRFIDHDGYLIQDQILDWLRVLVRGILSEHKNILRINKCEYKVTQENHGPAVTLNVNVGNCPFAFSFFSIDLVPALQFQSNDKWVADRKPVLGVPRYWNAIPKPNKSFQHKNRDWICSYAEIERDYLNGLNRIKPLIRIFKKIRDKVNLTNLKSYYIKTIFLHQRERMTDNYWSGSLAVLFMEMFDVILEHLRTKTLWSLWHHDYNLFQQLDEYQLDALYYNLKRIRERIVKNLSNNNPEIIYEEILTSSEIAAMERKEQIQQAEEGWCTIL